MARTVSRACSRVLNGAFLVPAFASLPVGETKNSRYAGVVADETAAQPHSNKIPQIKIVLGITAEILADVEFDAIRNACDFCFVVGDEKLKLAEWKVYSCNWKQFSNH